MNKNNKLAFYEVSERYINYLKRFEDKIPNIKYETREKFVCGILFYINGIGYYAPVSSFNKPQRTNHIIKVGEYPVGSIRFSFMFPVPQSEIQRKDFSKEDQNYKNLINSEYRYCKLHQDAILKKAREVYDRTIHKVPIYKMNCCDFKLLEVKCKEWGRKQMKNQNREVFFIDENIGIGNLLNYQESLERLELGIPICMEAEIDKEGKFYTHYELDDMFKNISINEEYQIRNEKGIKSCYIEIKNTADFETMYSKFFANCIISPAVMNVETSNKFNRTMEVMTQPCFCFDQAKCNDIKLELLEAKPLTVEKLIDISKKYIDQEALSKLKTNCEKNSPDPNTFDILSNEIDWTAYENEQKNLKKREEEIIWGKDEEGAECYAKDLEVALETAKDIDGADIPNNTPEERMNIKTEIKKAKKQKQEITQKEKKKDIHVAKEKSKPCR